MQVTDAFKARCFDEALVSMVKLEQENDGIRKEYVDFLHKVARQYSVATENLITPDEWWSPTNDLSEDAWEKLVWLGVAYRHPMSCFRWYRMDMSHVREKN